MCNVNPSLPIHPAPLVSVFVLFVCELSVFSASALIALRKDFCSHRVFAQVALENYPGPSSPGSSLACMASDAMRTDLKDVCAAVPSVESVRCWEGWRVPITVAPAVTVPTRDPGIRTEKSNSQEPCRRVHQQLLSKSWLCPQSCSLPRPGRELSYCR